ncbi:lipopolysaccharide-binding protein-like isoform X1 [Octodon degus]|uniref:Bactericidal permeability-increasing protein n=1 Tax=Octodon degus TaxID=10160 RepID=A0A6P6EEB8_OCTDE|nr:lipopolysaccharide-binding protein-like isoform X1 [Octodon degus]
MMLARPYCAVVVLLLLAGVSRTGEGNSNPGFMARITKKGLEYVQQYVVTTLKEQLSTIRLPDLSGHSKIDLIGWVSYDFHSLKIHRFVLQNWNLNLLPELGIGVFLSNSYMSVGGDWKVNKAFITLDGSFELKANGISISLSLNLDKDQSGRPTASVTECSNSIGHISIHLSGSLSWILNLFHEIIENNIKMVLEEKVCDMVTEFTTSYLELYLRTLPVTTMIDEVASLDYRLVGAPQVTSEGLDIPFKGEFFSQSHPSHVPFEAPSMMLPPQHDRMIYLAVSQYMLNTAIWVYHHAGCMKVVIQNEDLARLYPNMEVELEVSLESEPLLTLTPGNVTLSPVIDIRGLALLPSSSDQRTLFQLRVNTNVSIAIGVNSNRIVGSVTIGSELKFEVKQSNLGNINKKLMESIFSYYTIKTIYSSLNAKLQEGFPLPLPRETSLNSVELQIHKNLLFVGAYFD